MTNTAAAARVRPASRLERCPSPGHSLDFRTANRAAADQLVPPDPSSALICRYAKERDEIFGEKPSYPQRLALRKLGSGRELTTLVAELDSLEPVEEGEFSCGEIPSAPLYLLAFHYSGAADDYVRAEYNYCAWASNGLQPRAFYPSSPLQARLDALLADRVPRSGLEARPTRRPAGSRSPRR